MSLKSQLCYNLTLKQNRHIAGAVCLHLTLALKSCQQRLTQLQSIVANYYSIWTQLCGMLYIHNFFPEYMCSLLSVDRLLVTDGKLQLSILPYLKNYLYNKQYNYGIHQKLTESIIHLAIINQLLKCLQLALQCGNECIS